MEHPPAIVSGLVWIPYRYYTKESARSLVQRLTVTPRGYEGKVRQPIGYWTKCDERKMVGLPIEFGMQQIKELGIPPELVVEDITDGREVDFNSSITARDQAQQEFFDSIIHSLENSYTVLATAPTGTGKSVALLQAIAHFGLTALIIVDSRVLADQWIDEAKKHLGLKDSEIGKIQGSRSDFRDKKIVVAVIHNLVQKEFSEEFYRYFGFVAWDEGQILGAESFSQSMRLFPARYRITVSATPERKDGCTQMIYDYFARPRVVATQEALPCDVYVVDYRRGYRKTSAPVAMQLTWLSQDVERNRLIVQIALKEWAEGRHFLVVSDRIEQLQYLMEWCAQSGVPRNEMGLFTRSYTDEAGKEKTNTKEYLDWCKREPKILFGVYQMIEKAVNIPHLDSGIDATPRSSKIQLLGRVRRSLPGKPKPRWFTIRDVGNPKFSGRFAAGIRDCNKDKAVTLHYPAA